MMNSLANTVGAAGTFGPAGLLTALLTHSVIVGLVVGVVTAILREALTFRERRWLFQSHERTVLAIAYEQGVMPPAQVRQLAPVTHLAESGLPTSSAPAPRPRPRPGPGDPRARPRPRAGP